MQEQPTTTPTQSQNKILPSLGRRIPNYVGDRACSQELAKKLEAYYHKKGYTHIKVWVEADDTLGTKIWSIRSNILFSLPK